MMEAPETARLTAPMSPLPPMPPPVLVCIWTESDIQLNSPASDTTDSPSVSPSSRTGIVLPWIVSSIVTSSNHRLPAGSDRRAGQLHVARA